MAKRKSKQSTKSTNPNIGDVFEIPLKKGVAYGQYVNYDRKTYGELVRVLPGIFTGQECIDLDELARQEGLYVCFFPLKDAIKDRVVRVIGNADIPVMYRTMPQFKTFMQHPQTRKRTWWIRDSIAKKPRKVASLSKVEEHFPLTGIVSYGLLIERIEEGWRPEHECR